MTEELAVVEDLKKYAFSVIQSIVKSEHNKYAIEALMAEAVHTLEDAVYEEHGELTSYIIY